IKYPLIIKSNNGSGSNDIYKAENEKELKFFINYNPNSIAQEFIFGKEYTIDLFSDFDKNVISVVPRERIETFGGESYKGKTVKDEEIINQTKKLAETIGSFGHITVQCIKNENKIMFIEINPRFGGGASLSFAAGVNTPRMLIKLLMGKKINHTIGNFKELTMLRHTKDIFI
ncbi:MAG: ATP-grasp domain-containing protein, partial [Candidatus Aenigmarchaeota archaeon]|nr:ATP-grasp domain-containing protein [Candidatus Aenigmarchaeota archaeon]